MNGKWSVFKMEERASAVPPASVLGLVIFAVFINGLGKGVSRDGAEFAGEAELCSVVKMSAQCRVQERSCNEWLDDKMTN